MANDFWSNGYWDEGYFPDGYFGVDEAAPEGAMFATLSGGGDIAAGLSSAEYVPPFAVRGGASGGREDVRKRAKRQRKLDEELLETVRKAHPQHKAKLRRVGQDAQDEEDLITMMLLRKAA